MKRTFSWFEHDKSANVAIWEEGVDCTETVYGIKKLVTLVLWNTKYLNILILLSQ